MVTTRSIFSIAASLASIANAYVIKIDHHENGVKTYDIPGGNMTAEEFLRTSGKVEYNRRQVNENPMCPGQDVYSYRLIGNGDPHQNYKIAQVKDTLIKCSPGATVQTGHEHTFSWSFNADIGGGNEYAFASVGFSVGESDTKSVNTAFECGANGMSEICAMHYTAVTAVSVEFLKTRIDNCGGSSDTVTGTGVVYLPNANGVGSYMARGANFGSRNIIQCRGQDQRELLFACGPAGGPEWFDTKELGPGSEAYQAEKVPQDCFVPIEAFQFND